MSLVEHLDRMRADPARARNFRVWRHLPPEEPNLVPFPDALDTRLAGALTARGIAALYCHQAEAVEAALAGEHVAVVTPTASGKTLCYNLPVLNTLLAEPEARALYLFPTKALSMDQVDELLGLVRALEVDIKAYTYDGDTPGDARRAIRTAGHRVVPT